MNKEFCTKCGEELKEDSAFCTSCGNKFNSENSINEATLKSGKNKKILFGVIAFIAFIVFAFIIGNGKESTNNSVKAENSQVIRVKAEEVINDYIRDQSSAEQKYKDKRVIVTGKVIDKNQFNNSQDYAMLIATNITAGKTYGVIAAIPNEKIELINKVKVGDFVNVEGICVGTVKQANPTIISIQIQDPKINQ